MPNPGLYAWSAVVFVAALCIIVGVGVTAVQRRRRTEQLRFLFGPEYDRAVRLYRDPRRAEAALEQRRRRLSEMGVHELSTAERDEFRNTWASIQAASLSDPAIALDRADTLLAHVLRAEGCTTVDPDERKIDLALIHPSLADDYRLASDIIAEAKLGRATPEECRRAMLRFARIFDAILGEPDLRARLQKVS